MIVGLVFLLSVVVTSAVWLVESQRRDSRRELRGVVVWRTGPASMQVETTLPCSEARDLLIDAAACMARAAEIVS